MMKKMNIKRQLGIGTIGCGLMAALALTGCTEWDDHYSADAAIQPTATETVWENIQKRSDLTQFKELLQRVSSYQKTKGEVGIIDRLNATTSYTVWAPKDGTYDYESLRSLNDSLLLARFVENHVSQYQYALTGKDSINVQMLNLKKSAFKGNGSYTIADIPVDEANIASKNGVLHVIDQALPYRPNIYQLLSNETAAIDSISDYIHKFDVRELDLDKSTPGPMVDGRRTYYDSVWAEYNNFIQSYRMYINREDSNYTMLAPTNKAWADVHKTIKDYFNYIPSMKYLDGSTDDAERTKNTKTSEVVDAAYLQDSVATEWLTSCLFLNNNWHQNKALKTLAQGETLQVDSLEFAWGLKLFDKDAANLFDGAVRHEASNGVLFEVDSVRWPHWVGWNPPFNYEAEYRQPSAFNGCQRAQTQGITIINDKETRSYTFSHFRANANKNPYVDYFLTGIRSTEYNIYAVIVPEQYAVLTEQTQLTNRLMFTLGANDESGELTIWRFKNGEPFSIKFADINKGKSDGDYHVNNIHDIDTMYVGTFRFPVAYSEYTTNVNPFLRIQDMGAGRDEQGNPFCHDLNIDAIILVPTELDDHLRKYPGSVYLNPTRKTPIPLKPNN